MKCRYVGIITAGLFALAGSSFSQQQSTDPAGFTIHVQSQLVQIYLTVTEGTRRVTELKPTDFRLTEDGVPKELDRLDSGTMPLYVALLLDTSESMREALATTQEAAAFFVESLNARDRVTLIPFNSDIRSIPQLSEDRTPILHAIRSTQARGGTKLYDALLFGMKHLSGKEGRKAIVVFSDGEDTARSASLNITLNAAARYGYPIYTIGAGAGLKRDTLKRILRQLAEINSGKTYVVDDPRDLRAAFDEVSSELRSAYVLNYYTQVPFDGRWHDVRINLPNHMGLRIHSRKGFYAKAGGSNSLFTELGDSKKGVAGLAQGNLDIPPEEKNAQIASAEIVKTAVAMRDLDSAPISAIMPRGSPAAPQSKVPVFKVESRLIEVPVLLESTTDKEMPGLSQKDFRIYEDDSLREIAFFSKEISTQNISQLREDALKKVNSGKSSEPPVALSRDTQELRLGRYYLILDDLMSEASAYLTAKKYAEKIVRDYHTSFRPISLHFTSQAQADVFSDEGVESMVSKIQKSMPRASRELTSNDNLMSVFEAYLIERGDTRATQLADLRYASSIFVHYRNALGEVEGHDGMSAEVIENTVLNNSRQLLSENFAQVSRALDGLRAVVNAASADMGEYPKTVLYISSGFSVGRGSGRSDMAGMLDNIIAAAKRNRIRVFTVDATGLAVDESLGIGANMGFLVRNPHLSSILSDHSRGWRIDRQSPLAQLAAETGGRFQHSNNDLSAPIAAAVRTAGQLYYLGYLSKQPTDGRFHKIRVTTSLMSAKVYARKGYFAGRHNDPETLASTSMDGEDWGVVLKRANDARKSGNMKELAASLEQLVRRFPNQGDFWYNLGAAHLNLGNPQRAVDALQRAFAISPDDMNVGLTLSQAFVAAGYRAAASETLQTMSRRQPRHIGLLMQLGRVYESETRIREAYQTYRKILDLQLVPPMELYPLLTRTSMRLGRQVEAGLFIQEYLARGGAPAEAKAWREVLTSNSP